MVKTNCEKESIPKEFSYIKKYLLKDYNCFYDNGNLLFKQNLDNIIKKLVRRVLVFFRKFTFVVFLIRRKHYLRCF